MPAERYPNVGWRLTHGLAARKPTMLRKITAILLILAFVALFAALLSGCTSTEVKLSSGATYRSTRLLTDAGVDEATINPETGAVSIKGVRSDSSKGLDVAIEALRTARPSP